MDFMCKINMRKGVKIAHNAMVSWDNNFKKQQKTKINQNKNTHHNYLILLFLFILIYCCF